MSLSVSLCLCLCLSLSLSVSASVCVSLCLCLCLCLCLSLSLSIYPSFSLSFQTCCPRITFPVFQLKYPANNEILESKQAYLILLVTSKRSNLFLYWVLVLTAEGTVFETCRGSNLDCCWGSVICLFFSGCSFIGWIYQVNVHLY